MARILVINEDHQAAAIREALVAGGHEIETAATAEEGMTHAHDAVLVILPVLIPGRLSLNSLHDFRSRFPNLPILVVMGRPPSYQDARLLELLGATRMIEYPFQATAFLALVAATLRLDSRQNPSPLQQAKSRRA